MVAGLMHAGAGSLNGSGLAFPDTQSAGVFQTTSWSVVLAAGKEDSREGEKALERLCGLYWPPLYSYLRRNGRDQEAARDLTQQFFLQLFQRETIRKANPARGRFRTFLLTAMQNFLTDEWKAAKAIKRGGGRPHLSLDGLEDHERMAIEPAESDTPAKAFDRRWAQVVLDEAARRHQQEHSSSGQMELYNRLSGLHSALEESPGYATFAAEMGVPAGTLKSLVSRFRRRYRELIRETIAETVTGPEELEDEIRHLLQVFSK